MIFAQQRANCPESSDAFHILLQKLECRKHVKKRMELGALGYEPQETLLVCQSLSLLGPIVEKRLWPVDTPHKEHSRALEHKYQVRHHEVCNVDAQMHTIR
jgi:hypothetical protein